MDHADFRTFQDTSAQKQTPIDDPSTRNRHLFNRFFGPVIAQQFYPEIDKNI